MSAVGRPTASQRLQARIEALKDAPVPQWMPSARELLHVVLDHIDLECFLSDGRARYVAELPEHLLNALIEWDDDGREPDEDSEEVSV